jgi:hypothetical protein
MFIAEVIMKGLKIYIASLKQALTPQLKLSAFLRAFYYPLPTVFPRSILNVWAFPAQGDARRFSAEMYFSPALKLRPSPNLSYRLLI